jgi:hypothetical protein
MSGPGVFDRVSATIPTNTGVVMVGTEKGIALRFGATDDLDGYGVVSGVKTIALVIRPTANTKLLQDDGADVLEISGGVYVASGMTATYVNNVSSTTAPSDVWQLVIAEFSGGVSFATDLEIDVTAATDIAVVWMSDEISATARADLYADFLRRYHISKPMETNKGTVDQIVSWSAAANLRADGRTVSSGDLDGLNVASGSVVAVEGGKQGDNEILGPERNTDSNAIANIDGVEADNDPSPVWFNLNLNGTGANIFENQSSYVSLGNYAFHAESNDTPTHDARIFHAIQLYESLQHGKTYKLSIDARHVGIGGDWAVGIGTFSNSTTLLIATLTSSDIIFTTYELYFTHVKDETDNLVIKENSLTNDGGVYIDNFSVKEVISPIQKQVVALENTTLQIQGINLSEFVGNGWIKSLGGSLSAEAGQTVDAATNVSYTDNTLTITLTAGQTLTGIAITPTE